MKKFFFSLLMLGSTVVAFSQELLTFGGYHTQLFGYTDQRYVEKDQGDYLKTLAWYTGTEFVQRGFKTESDDSSHVVLGGGLLLYVQDGFAPVSLYAVPTKSIAAETVPANIDDRAALFQLTASLFGGYQEEWWGAEGGLSVFIKGVEEKVRKKVAADGTIFDGPGRGWVFGDGSLILPNLRFRMGSVAYPHFVLGLFRENFDPGYGAFQARVVMPLGDLFGLVVGGTLFQTSSLFLEPSFKLGAYTLAVRAGTILNYNNSSFTRVGIFEGAFVSASLAAQL